MSLADLFAYYLGANYEYNEKLKELFSLTDFYDFKSNERNLIGITPNQGKIYIKVLNNNGTLSYYEMKKSNNNKYIDGGNIESRGKDYLFEAEKLVQNKSILNICKRLKNRIMVEIDGISYEAVIINKVGEELSVFINSHGHILYIKYDYQSNDFSTNFEIDWLTFTESMVDKFYIPDELKKYISHGGEKYNFKSQEKEFTINEYESSNDLYKYFYKLR